jgi:hypothetical protein
MDDEHLDLLARSKSSPLVLAFGLDPTPAAVRIAANLDRRLHCAVHPRPPKLAGELSVLPAPN